jgi:toxin-antitoxin system PIN domain toxin
VKYLLDVNVLLAAIWSGHPQHAQAFAWLDGKAIVTCPLCELGFVRISTNKRAINAPMEQSRELLKRFLHERKAGFVADDLSALDSEPATSDSVTDTYLADLAGRHNLKLATLDAGINHPAAELVS